MPFYIPTWALPVAASVAIIALIVWGVVLLRAYRARKATEAAIASVAYEMLKNVLIPNGNGGYIHVQYLLLTQRGLLVAGGFDLPGAVVGGGQNVGWTGIGQKRP